ncbi:MAG: hypothetical protein A2580_08645 [Hydrogenophilales bacterium RIFOXYD1_FULL_62_11]|nr:MAG: hypothetical protein A2580_08645 [Hydrogenophilales bacterium RIFOXYD1_FULL_62_11]
MNLETIIGTCFVIALTAVMLWFLIPSTGPVRTAGMDAESYEDGERARMPLEIARGRLVVSEKTFFRRGRRPFAAKVDQGFVTPDGWFVLVETKTRRRISPSDLVQITAQAMAVADSPGNAWKVGNWGYIRLAPAGKKPFYQRVDLIHPDRMDVLWDRWHALKTGRAAPIARPQVRRCDRCALRRTCPDAILR